MTASGLILLALFGLTALNWTIHWYTQMVTYRLFPEVARHMGGEAFVAYHRAYQARRVWAIYSPWSLLMMASIAFALVAPSGAASSAWLLLLLNGAIGVVSVVLAVPVHARIDREHRLEPADAQALLRANLLRLVIASVSLGLCATVATGSLTPASRTGAGDALMETGDVGTPSPGFRRRDDGEGECSRGHPCPPRP